MFHPQTYFVVNRRDRHRSRWATPMAALLNDKGGACWSVESQCGKGCVSCGPSCRASLRREPMRSRPALLRVLEDLLTDWRHLDTRIEDLSGDIETLARQDKGCERLMSVPVIGPIISSAMLAAIGTGDAFSKGRDFGAWLGLVPKRASCWNASLNRIRSFSPSAILLFLGVSPR
jgi:hypothetical protein